MKQLTLLLSALIVAIVAIHAEIAPGSWRTIPSFTEPAQNVVIAGKRIYFATGGSLFCYDTEEETTSALTRDTGLAGTKLTTITELSDGKSVAVGYEDGDIDIINSDGEIVNLTDIRDAALDEKSINAIAQAGKRLVAATDFGLVILDIENHSVVSYGIYGVPFTAAAIVENDLFTSDGKQLYRITLATPLPHRLTDISPIAADIAATEIAPVGNNCLLIKFADSFALFSTANNELRRIAKIDATKSTFSRGNSDEIKADEIFVATGSRIFCVTSGGTQQLATLPTEAKNNLVATTDGTTIWALDKNGITELKKEGSDWTTILPRFKPETVAVAEVGVIIPGADEQLYFSAYGPTNYRNGGGSTDALDMLQATSVLTADGWKDVTAATPPLSPTRLAEDPADNSTYLVGTGRDGLKIVNDGEIVGWYGAHNAPMDNSWGSRVYEVSFDAEGNMWVGARGITKDRSIMILPSDRRAKGAENVTSADWVVPAIDSYEFSKDIRIFHCADRRTTIIFDAGTEHIMVAYDNNATPANFADDRWRVFDSFTDQDGLRFKPLRLTSIAEDKDGSLWIGTASGVVEIANPAEALEPNFTVRRLKIDHADGTGLADYLAETDNIYDIAIDGARRKWIATEQSGIYVVSPDGKEIVRQFTMTNSPLPADRVNAIYCSPTSRSVYVATPAGLLEYGNDASPSVETMDELKVYPNPYRPANHGSLTIEGLTDGALVKIATASGAVVKQLRAEGGTAVWDGRTDSGAEASSGVYFILASPPTGSDAASATGKFVIVK